MAGGLEPTPVAQGSGQPDSAVTHDTDAHSNGAATGTDVQNLPLRPQALGAKTNGDHNEAPAGQQHTQEDGSGQDDEEEQDDLQSQDHGVASNVPPVEEKKKKRRKKKKPASKRGLDKPTGFEDFFADAPMTPEEHAEEQELYDAQLHFVDRILTAIARFERTRKLTPKRRDFLYKYLAYGGLTVGPNVGQGSVNTDGLSKVEVAQALSQVFAAEDKRDLGTETSLYEVDFLGCIKSFLSRRTKNVWGLETRAQVDLICTTIERFLDYLLQHDVCPEYNDDILASRSFCRVAAAELWDTAEALRRLPGEFNIACSTLFDGSYAHNYDGETWWGQDDEGVPVFVGMKSEEAQQIVKFGVAGAATETVYLGFLDGVQNHVPLMLDVIDVQEHMGFEIMRIEPPSKECKQIYTSQSAQFRPVGRVTAKPWRNPMALTEDLTDAEREAGASSTSQPAHQREYVFFVESILQSMLRVGTKIEATVRTLGCGIMFFDEVLNVYPSFDEFIANEMLIGWKPPKPMKGANDYASGEDSDEDEGEGEGEEEAVNEAGNVKNRQRAGGNVEESVVDATEKKDGGGGEAKDGIASKNGGSVDAFVYKEGDIPD
ncbi:hypothetical protein CLCR_05629 [Cladophialophora carrionii]|uniref:Argonaute complex, subunit Arb1 n=1 Tax=Cladophialophora carrionii TaxID=86049 RepID=A0A1C1C795_9EURO|nr:hypothetical protein CLCR_05629 [Cladophialophora carrionii]